MQKVNLPKPFLKAKEQSLLSDHYQHKLGVVITVRNRIVAKGHNHLTKTHPFVRQFDQYKTIHAEIDALLKARRFNLKGSCLYVYRETKNGDVAMSRPCATCQKIIKMLGVEKICYTTTNGWAEEFIL